MNELLKDILMTCITAFVTWFLARRKTDAETKSIEIDNEIKSAEFYKGLLDDATHRLNEAIETINKQDARIKSLMQEVEHLTEELKKFKQLNGKQ